MLIPEQLAAACLETPERQAWLKALPNIIREIEEKWSLSLAPPFDGRDVSCSWVAPAVRADGSRAVLKLGMPHMEAAHELQGLQFWNGDPTVRLLEADVELNAMLLECCEPGFTLRDLQECEQDVVIADLLRRLWRKPSTRHPFRPLSTMIEYWRNETIATASEWIDAGLVREGLVLFEELARPSHDDVVLATDLHAGNVLRAQRKPWLVIDPKPFVGDRAYDATQHLFNCRERLLAAPDATIKGFADLLEVDTERVRLWMFARAAAEPRDDWSENSMVLARLLSRLH